MSAVRLASTPLRLGRTLVRSIQDGVYDCPLPWYQPRIVSRGLWSSAAIAEGLRTQGICILERMIEGEPLRRYQDALDVMLTETARQASSKQDVPKATMSRIDLTRTPLFADLVVDEMILAGIETYYGKPLYLAATQAQRLEPIDSYEGKAFQWHHDTKGKYVKAMWLLSDVPSSGQRMSYVQGSHAMRHPWTTYEETRFADATARTLGPVVECAAPAGSVVVFDTNGIHRGNRNLGPRRDTVVGVYTAGRYLEGCAFEPSRLTHLTEWQQRIMRRSRAPSKEYRW